MKQTLLLFTSLLFFISTTHAQIMPGIFYHDIGFPYGTSGSSPCVADSSFYMVRYGGVESFSEVNDSVYYKWNRFYNAQALKHMTDSSLILLKGGLVYEYFINPDSIVNISGSLAATVTDIDASDSVIWAIVAFNEIGRYTPGSGWQIITLGSSFNPLHILAVSDTSVYLQDNSSVRFYSSTAGLYGQYYSSSDLYYFNEWSKDSAGNAWLLANAQLIKVTSTGAGVIYSGLGSTGTHLSVSKTGLVWVSDNEYLYQFNGTSGVAYNFQSGYNYVSSIYCDWPTGNTYLVAGDSLYIISDSAVSRFAYGDMPYHNAKAVSLLNIATDQGIFTFDQNNYLAPADFKDTSVAPYANDVTCFVATTGQTIDSGYGTHHGVYSTTYPINNSQLPDSNINCIYYMNGSYYIGTDKGLCIFNQIIYTTYDTSNSGLPNDTVTSVISYLSPYTNVQELWVGTTAGVALYSNGLWHKFDTSIVHIPTFNVTGILPCPLYYTDPDTSIWISTMGSGLVKLKRDSSYTLLNTANGGFQDDSLYYITQYYGCMFNGTVIAGTNSHGIAYYVVPGNYWAYDTIGGGTNYSYHRSDLFATTYAYNEYSYEGLMIMNTDNGINFVGICANIGIIEKPADENMLKWYQMSDEKLQVMLPDAYIGLSSFCLYDMTGRKVLSTMQEMQPGTKVYLDISALSSGVYALQASNGSTKDQTKVIISK